VPDTVPDDSTREHDDPGENRNHGDAHPRQPDRLSQQASRERGDDSELHMFANHLESGAPRAPEPREELPAKAPCHPPRASRQSLSKYENRGRHARGTR
jgi:hypothetical protein